MSVPAVLAALAVVFLVLGYGLVALILAIVAVAVAVLN